MTGQLSILEERRLFALKLLHGTTSEYIAPTSDSLVAKLRESNIDMSRSKLSNLYLKKTSIQESLARQIEDAMSVSAGWLSVDHKPYLSATPDDIDLLQNLLRLPVGSREALAVFLRSLELDT